MKNPPDFPSHLPSPTDPPVGYYWKPLGFGFELKEIPKDRTLLIFNCLEKEWHETDDFSGDLCNKCFYAVAELVPIESPAEPDYFSLSHQAEVFVNWRNNHRVPREVWNAGRWVDCAPGSVWDGSTFYRIKPQPDPYADLKAAKAAGKVIQFRRDPKVNEWIGFSEEPRWNYPVDCYRIKPEPRMVPLEAGDCLGVLFKAPDGPIFTPCRIVKDGVDFMGEVSVPRSFKQLRDEGWLYSADRKTWTRCEKEAK